MKEVKNREVQFPNRYRLLKVDQNVYDILPEQGQVVAEGTPIDKELFDSIAEDIDKKVDKEEGSRLIHETEAAQIQTNKENISSHRTEVAQALAGKANKNHNHDDKYPTITEVNQSLNNKADKNHNHDNRYYTETEMDTKLSNKVDKNDPRLSDARPASDVYAWAKKQSLNIVDLPIIPVNKGGTNISSYTKGDILYALGTNTISKLPIGSAGKVLKSDGGVPKWLDDYSHPQYEIVDSNLNVSPGYGGTFSTISEVTVNSLGHILGVVKQNVTFPQAPSSPLPPVYIGAPEDSTKRLSNGIIVHPFGFNLDFFIDPHDPSNTPGDTLTFINISSSGSTAIYLHTSNGGILRGSGVTESGYKSVLRNCAVTIMYLGQQYGWFIVSETFLDL